MRKLSLVVASLLATLGGCASQQAARTELKGGKARTQTERHEVLPSKSTFEFEVEPEPRADEVHVLLFLQQAKPCPPAAN